MDGWQREKRGKERKDGKKKTLQLRKEQGKRKNEKRIEKEGKR